MAGKGKDGEDPAALAERGDQKQQSGDSAGALRDYDSALRSDPDDPLIWNNRGVALSSLGRYDEAIESYRKATERAPDKWTFWFNLGKVLQRKVEKASPRTVPSADGSGKPAERKLAPEQERAIEEAIVAYDRALLLNPSHTSSLNNKALALRDLKLYEEALSVYDALIGQDPLYAHAWHNKGELLRILDLLPEAQQCFEVAATLHPDFAPEPRAGGAGQTPASRGTAAPSKGAGGGPAGLPEERPDGGATRPRRRARRK